MNNWLKIGINVIQAVSFKNPIVGIVIIAIKAIVAKKNDGISNKSIIDVVSEMAKSKYNNLDTDKVLRIMDIINEKDKLDEDLEEVAEELKQGTNKLATDTFLKAKEDLK